MRYSAYFASATGGALYSKNPDLQMYPASASKIAIAFAGYSLLGIATIVTAVRGEELPRYASWYPPGSPERVPGSEVSVADLLRSILVESNNYDSNLLISAIGYERLVKFFENRGIVCPMTDQFVSYAKYETDTAPLYRKRLLISARDLARTWVSIDVDFSLFCTVTLGRSPQKSGYLYVWDKKFWRAVRRFFSGKPVAELFEATAGISNETGQRVYFAIIAQDSIMPWNTGKRLVATLLRKISVQ